MSVPRVRRLPYRPFVKPIDFCAVAAAGCRLFGKRYARIAHLFDPRVVLELDVATSIATIDAIRARLHARPLPISQGEPNQ